MLSAGRKVFIAMVAFALATGIYLVAVYKGGMTDTSWSTYCELLKWVVGLFCMGNVGEHVAGAIGAKTAAGPGEGK